MKFCEWPKAMQLRCAQLILECGSLALAHFFPLCSVDLET